MTQELYLIIIGAGITLVTTLVTSSLTFFVQYMREEKSRRWQIEDNQRSELVAIRKKRLGDLEKSLDYLTAFVKNIVSSEREILFEAKKHQNPNIIKLVEYISVASPTPAQTRKYMRENKITKTYSIKELNNLMQASKRIRAQHITRRNELAEFFEGVQHVFAINDPDVNEKTALLLRTVTNEYQNYVKLEGDFLDAKLIQYDEENKRISEFIPKFYSLRGEVIFSVDSAIIYADL